MLSRVADSVYWLSRYVERAESVARLIDVNYNLTLGENDSLGKQWAPLVYTTGDHIEYEERYGDPTRENVLKFLTFDKQNPNSILACVSNARENARTIREVIPQVVWEQLNKFYLLVRSAAQSSQTLEQPHEFCERVRLASHLLVGAAGATMSQGEAWHFARLGRMLERADKTSRIVDVQYFILLPNRAGRGVGAGRGALVGVVEISQCAGDVSPRTRQNRARKSRRFPGVGPTLPPSHAFLPDQCPGFVAAHHRQYRRDVS